MPVFQLKEAKEKELAEKAKIRDVHTCPTSLGEMQPEESNVMAKPAGDTASSQAPSNFVVSDASSATKVSDLIQSKMNLDNFGKSISSPVICSGTKDADSESMDPILPLMIPEVMTNETRNDDVTTPSNSTTSDTLQDQISVEDSRPTPDEVKSVSFEPLPHVSDSSSPMEKQEQPVTSATVS